VLIATGSSPLIPDNPGLCETPYLTSDLLTSQEGMELTALPHSLLILGGGYIALELGQMFARFGSEVTIITRGPSILTGYEPEIAEALTEILQEEGLRILTGTQVLQVEQSREGSTLLIQQHGRQQTLSAEKLLVAAGRRPNTGALGLEQAGVEIDTTGAVRVDHTLRTSVSHIWAAGDVIGREIESQMATPVGAHDGKIAAHNALSGEPPREVDHTVIPRTIFTDPQVAVVGLTDEEAVAAGITCNCNTIPLSVVPRAGAIRDTRGVIKMVLDTGGCAVDLFWAVLATGASVHAESRCPATGTPIQVDLSPEGVELVEPVGTVVTVLNPRAQVLQKMDTVEDANTNVCSQQSFFASAEAAASWLTTHPGGRIYPVAESFAWFRRNIAVAVEDVTT
jgi:pyruvate/2-oxoglutarate dehydrogenase complex dihydrolipoamide dehydrogenase (E3) component